MTEGDQRAAQAFISLVCQAAEYVHDPWFALPYAGATAPQSRVRERVYCYELYHQIRKLTEEPTQEQAAAPNYVLSAEIDKSGINTVVEGGQQKPDFVWHVPGTHRNAVVMEVKPSTSKHDIDKDLQTLTAFLEVPRRMYARGVLLVYGPSRPEEDLRAYVLRTAGQVSLAEHVASRIDLLHHPAAGTRVKNLGTLA